MLGDMRELGVFSDDAHAEIGRRAVAAHVDVLIGVGVGGRVIATAATPALDVRTAADAGEALEILRSLVVPGDAVLVKASRAVGLEVVAEALLGAAS